MVGLAIAVVLHGCWNMKRRMQICRCEYRFLYGTNKRRLNNFLPVLRRYGFETLEKLAVARF